MSFTTSENPHIRSPPKFTPRVYEAEGRRFETTGEYRHARKGEFVLGLFGVARVNNHTQEDMTILREITRRA